MTMSEVEAFSALVGDIYDASLDPGLWPSVLQKAGRYIGGSGAGLTSQETWRRSARLHFTWGTDPHYMRLYEEKYHKLNPAFPTVLFFPVEEPQHRSRLHHSRRVLPIAIRQGVAASAGHDRWTVCQSRKVGGCRLDTLRYPHAIGRLR